jgi:hypothetical protein
MRFIACGASVTGPRHRELCEPNQDAMTLSGCRAGWIAAVADGLGSRPRSELGAKRACQVSRRLIRETKSSFDVAEILPILYEQWLKSISPTDARDAATTLLFSYVSFDGHVHTAQLGDGFLLVKSEGIFRCITPDRLGYGNQTWALESVFDPDLWNISKCRLSRPGDGIILMTDGVADDLDPLHLSEFFDAIYRSLQSRNRRRGRRWLESELNDWATPMHSDDKTLVAIFRTS